MKAKVILFFISLTFLLISTANSQTAQPGQPGWQKDTRANCNVWNPHPQPGESVEWRGACANGYVEGEGELIWTFANGHEARTGRMSGGRYGAGPYTLVTTYNGVTMSWVGRMANNGVKTGINIRTFASGEKFEGNWVNGQVNGPSYYTYKCGEKRNVYAMNGCIWSEETGGTFINSVDKNKDQCLKERSTYVKDKGGVDATYADRVRRCIQERVAFLPQGRYGDNANPTSVHIVKLNTSGQVIEVTQTATSGNPAFDSAVEKGIRRCNPFPSPGSGSYPRDGIEVAYSMYESGVRFSKPVSKPQVSEQERLQQAEAQRKAQKEAADRAKANAEAEQRRLRQQNPTTLMDL